MSTRWTRMYCGQCRIATAPSLAAHETNTNATCSCPTPPRRPRIASRPKPTRQHLHNTTHEILSKNDCTIFFHHLLRDSVGACRRYLLEEAILHSLCRPRPRDKRRRPTARLHASLAFLRQRMHKKERQKCNTIFYATKHDEAS